MRPDVPLPVADGRLVALAGTALRLLATPPQFSEEVPDLGKTVGDPEVALDDLATSAQRPEVGGIASGEGATEEPLG